MRRSFVAVVLLVAACSPGETADSTTSTTEGTATTTTQAVVTTVSSATTTSAMATSTTSAPTTTTSTGIEGNWADEPLVTVGFGALGWWDGSDWIDAEEEAELPVEGGEDYQVIRLDNVASTTGGPETVFCEPLGLI